MSTIVVRSSILDLKTFEDVNVGKQADFAPVSTVEEALSRLGNNTEKLLSVINDGLVEETREKLRSDSAVPWRTFATSEDGEETDNLNGEFAGVMAKDPGAVNGLILNLAKTVFGFGKDMTREQKRAAKEKAKEMIKQTPAILEGLSKQ